MRLKNVLMVIGGFLAGVVTTAIMATKFVKAVFMRISKHEIFLQMVKDSWVDMFTKLLYGNTDDYVERKLKEEGYVRYKYRPRYVRYSDWKYERPEDEDWEKWKDNLRRKMKEREED